MMSCLKARCAVMKGLGELTNEGVGRPLSSGQNHELVVSFAGVSWQHLHNDCKS